MVLTKNPSEKQIKYAKDLAKKLKIPIPSEVLLDSRKCSAFISKAKELLEKKGPEEEKKEEKVAIESEEEIVESALEFYGYTNIEDNIVIKISVEEIRKNAELLKKKKGSSGKSLWEEFFCFLKTVKAKVDKRKNVYVFSTRKYSPAYIRTVIDSFFLSYQWKYTH